MFVDTHCHLHDQKLLDTDAVVKEYLRDGVDTVINAACCALTSEAGKTLAEKYPSVYFMTGCHPSDINGFNDDEFDRIQKLTSHEKCVAVGEIGLDYHWEPYDKEKQKAGFIRQIELASDRNLPISIHSRDATADTLKILKDNKSKLKSGAVMHCFSGSKETAEEILKLGIYISFAGPLTFKNARNLLDVARFVPDDMCLTETDSPYLAPHPLRGSVNSPKNVSLVTAFLAELKGRDVESMADIVFKNARRLFYKLK
ncbi:MAG: TatD family deoxyribonuclease [Clostridiales bacterium]|nr:TatD family deoxyribonuclease [Clostridiales bacterium]